MSMRRAAGIMALCALIGGAAAQEQATQALEDFEEHIPGTTVRFQMIAIPGGVLEKVGADGTRERIEIPPMWVSRTEVTWDLYDVYLYALDEPAGEGDGAISRPSKPYVPPDRGFGHSGFPAISMTRQAGERFCEWLTIRTGHKYRLPTSDEWEYFARAGSSGAYAFGDDASLLGQYAWFKGNTSYKTEPVARKKPNAWGLYDIHGNVAEWVMDPSEPRPIARGGAYLDDPEGLTFGAIKRQDFSWNASDPQIPKSTWWLSDCGFVGIRLVCEGPIRYGDDEPGEDGHGGR